MAPDRMAAIATYDYLPEYRWLLRYLLLHKMVKVSDLETLAAHVLQDFDETMHITDIFEVINKNIAQFHQKIVTMTDEVTGEYVSCLVVTDTDVFKNQIGVFSKNQNEYFIRIVKTIGESEGGCISERDALTDCAKLTKTKLSKATAKDYLESFMKKNLLQISEGLYCLTSLSVATFEDTLTYIRAGKYCFFCKKLVVFSMICDFCGTLFHRNCFKNFVSHLNVVNHCPKCRTKL